MSDYSIWPMLALLAAVLLLASTPLLKAADAPPSATPGRVETLDGLRGFLALAVFFHHSAIYVTFIPTGRWWTPPDRFYALLGTVGVAMFFMITGFLFWRQLTEARGRPDWLRLYVGRLFRIGPLYWVMLALLTLAVFAVTGFQLATTPLQFAATLLKWSSLGLEAPSPINAYPGTGYLIADVIWTLKYEWWFYASLVLTAFLARGPKRALAFTAAGLAVFMALLAWEDFTSRAGRNSTVVALFFVGMATASLAPYLRRLDARGPVVSAVVGALLLAVLVVFGSAYDAAPICLLGLAFFLIARGAPLFGLLTWRSAVRLGNISFGLYLLHGLVLATVFATDGARRFDRASPWNHWALVALAMLLLVALATAAHALVERPGVDLGRRLLRRLRREAPQPA